MLDPTGLFTFESHIDQRTIHARTLVVTLGSYADAGHSQRIINDLLLNTLESHQIGHFDADQVFDYAGHRPPIVFDRDHFTGYQPPQITLHQVNDPTGTPFLLLSGPEPALQWERMAAAVGHIIDQLDVEETVLVQGVPAPVPHTRPIQVTRFAGDPAKLTEAAPLPGAFVMSSSFPGLLTIRLAESDHHVLGLVAHIPHYLSDSDVPDGALALIKELHRATSLKLPEGQLPAASATARVQIDAQVNQHEELSAMIEQLEQQYDSFTQARQSITAREGDLPSADDLGREAEEFLRGLGGPPEGSDAENPPEEAPEA